MNEKFDLIIVGAGAAGLMAAGRAGELGAKVLVLEKMRQEGRKLLITGKGRCNITNDAPLVDFIGNIFPDGRFLRNTFSKFFSEDIIRLLAKYGTESTLERGGRYFPASNKSADVLEALLKYVKEANVEILCGQRVEKLVIENNTVKGLIANGRLFKADRIILATGGKSYPATGSNGDGLDLAKRAGHKIEKTRPSLVPLETKEKIPKQLSGLTLKNTRVSVWVNGKKITDRFGEVTFMDFGLSGPVILTLSRSIVDELGRRNSVELIIDLKPALDEQKLDNRLLRDLNDNGNKKVGSIIGLWLPADLINYFIQVSGIDPEKECSQVSARERKKIRFHLKNMSFRITGHRSFKEAIITAGGVSTKEIDSTTMESKTIKGLYFAGEIIDLDASTGGYNLQIAWSTGWVAGDSCGTRINDEIN